MVVSNIYYGSSGFVGRSRAFTSMSRGKEALVRSWNHSRRQEVSSAHESFVNEPSDRSLELSYTSSHTQ
jgi:hypothetical protein